MSFPGAQPDAGANQMTPSRQSRSGALRSGAEAYGDRLEPMYYEPSWM
jgi:hypothetical protein